MIAAADPFSLAGFDLAAAVGSAGFAAGSAVAVVGPSVAVDSAVADLACSVAAGAGKGRAVVAISCSLAPRSSF